jgi:predicted DNA-binding protein
LATRDRLGQHTRREERAEMKKDEKSHSGDDWVVEDVVVDRPVSAVVSVRLPQAVAQRVSEEAERRGLPMSSFVRMAVEEYLDSCENARIQDWTFSSNDVSVFFYGGRSANLRTVGDVRDIHDFVVTS